MSNNDSDRIVQIMPATRGETVVFFNDDGSSWTEPVIGWGLYESGDTYALTAGTDGSADPVGEGREEYYLHQPEAEGVDYEQIARETKCHAIESAVYTSALYDARARGLGNGETRAWAQRALAEYRAKAEQ